VPDAPRLEPLASPIGGQLGSAPPAPAITGAPPAPAITGAPPGRDDLARGAAADLDVAGLPAESGRPGESSTSEGTTAAERSAATGQPTFSGEELGSPGHSTTENRATENRATGHGPAGHRPAGGGTNGHGARHASHADSRPDPYTALPDAHAGAGRDYRPAPDGSLSLGPWPREDVGDHHDRTDAGGPAPLPRRTNGHASSPRHDQGAAGQVRASHLSEDDSRLVAGLLAACQAAEGQNLFGEYGESGLTPAMRRIAAQLPQGGLAPGSEADALKSAERLAAKLVRLIARHPGRSTEELAAGIGDGVRYAFTFGPDFYTEGTWLVHRKLKTQGFELEARRNRWESPEYKGVWTRWRDPAHGLAFEVQFHTDASWDVVRRTHGAYLQITDPATPAAERARLRARQVAAAATAKAPPHCAEISDFGREAR
jgi:hypothetical protein